MRSNRNLRTECHFCFLSAAYFSFIPKGCRMPKKVLVALPPGLLEQIDFVAQVEHRTRSDLIREALRRYIEGFKRTQSPQMSVSTIGNQKVALFTEE